MKQLFNNNWFFKKAPLESDFSSIKEDAGWDAIDIPHDWIIYDITNVYEQGVMSYRKTFTAPAAEGNRTFLRFEGVYMDTEIYLNDELISEWKYGYSTFDIDITDHIKDGENTIYVKTICQIPNSRWYPGGGIYRNVWLIQKPETRLAFDGVYVASKKLDNDTWEMFVNTEYISNENKPADIIHTLCDAEGKTVATQNSSFTLDKGTQTNGQTLSISSPAVWDIESPNLYSLTTQFVVDGDEVDSITQNVGFKTYRFDPNEGFFLNDRHVKIHGACLHHTLGALGAAVNKEAIRRQFTVMKEMGVNSIRAAHNMPAVEFMDLADEMGLLIYSESFDMWENKKTDHDYGKFFKEWWEKDLASWVRRDRNHPSLFVWGIGNEIHDTHYERGIEVTKMLRDAVYELDPMKNGVVGMGSNYIEWENAQKCADEIDIVGYNYSEHLYDKHHEKFSDWCIFGSETSSTVQSRGIYHFPASNRLLTYDDLQCSSLGNCTTNWGAKNSMKAIADDRDRDFCFGQYIWSGCDYIGEPTPYFTKSSYFGQTDTACYPKDTYYAYQAEWTDYKKAPMVHLLPYWDFNKGQLIDIRAYSNAPKIELFFNNVSQGACKLDHKNDPNPVGEWQLPYTKGTLRVDAYDENGNVIASDIQSSFSDPVRIVATPDKNSCLADGMDLIFVTIETEDKDGNYVANSRSRVNVKVSGAGRLIGLDNGDSSDYEQYKVTSRKLFSGKLLAIIAAKTEPGDISVTISSPGLETSQLTLKVEPTELITGMSAFMENTASEQTDEVPVRKIELTNHGTNHLCEENQSTTVSAVLLPANTTFSDITFKALTLDGVDSNCVKVESDGSTAKITALGDGEFRLCVSASNGTDHPEVLSELEFDITGMGTATYNPYELVSGISHTDSNHECKLSFLGGVYITSNERTYLTFENVDFGEFGSDTIILPIFSFDDELDFEIWEGHPEQGGEKLLTDTYRAKSWYNHYQENTSTLSRKLKGTCTVGIVVYPKIKMSIQGFRFEKLEKAYSTVLATDNTRITGDMFTVTPDAITDIGNNVTIEFDNMDFGEKGFTNLTICGHSPIEMNTIHVRFSNDMEDINQIVEFSYSEGYEERTFALDSVKGNYKLNLIFLPGSKFDLKWFKFF